MGRAMGLDMMDVAHGFQRIEGKAAVGDVDAWRAC